MWQESTFRNDGEAHSGRLCENCLRAPMMAGQEGREKMEESIYIIFGDVVVITNVGTIFFFASVFGWILPSFCIVLWNIKPATKGGDHV